jgi:hypothetical protein
MVYHQKDERMKLSKMTPYTTPFVDTPIISIKAKKVDAEFIVKLKAADITKSFPCNGKPDVAFVEMEAWVNKSGALGDNKLIKVHKKLSNRDIAKRLKK